MNIEYSDAKDATRIANASNMVGVANSMETMLLNAVDVNYEYLNDDVAVHWIQGHLRAIMDAGLYSDGLFPFSLRQEVFMHTKALYQMAYRIEHRNGPMSYPPLVIAVQALANITANDSYRVGENRGGLVSHEELEAIDHGMPSPFSGEVCGEWVYANWYSDAMNECEEAVRLHEEAEAAKTDEDRLQEAVDAVNWLAENKMDGIEANESNE